MRLLAAIVIALFAVAPAAAADVGVSTLAPTEDVSLPFFCDWGYDWDERCYRDDSQRHTRQRPQHICNRLQIRRPWVHNCI